MVVLQKGDRRLETQQVTTVGTGQPVAEFRDEKLSMLATVHRNRATDRLKDCFGNLIVQIQKE